VADAPQCYYLDGSRNQQGPVAAADVEGLIRSGAIRRDTLVWYAGMPDWRPAGEVSEFASSFARAAPPPPAFPDPPSVRRTVPSAGPYAGQAPQAPARQFQSGGRMGLGRAIATCFRKYVDFTGRARRSEYWFFILFNWLVLIPLIILDANVFGSRGGAFVFTLLGMLVLFLPSLAAGVRRLHDRDHSGWMMLLPLVPFGWIILLVFMCLRGTDGPNRFGPMPGGLDLAAEFD
jgi:uncharacterized membrane protein YhaH (DUF805 family)